MIPNTDTELRAIVRIDDTEQRVPITAWSFAGHPLTATQRGLVPVASLDAQYRIVRPTDATAEQR